MSKLEEAKPASPDEVREFCRTAPKAMLDRVARQRVIAELLEAAARRAQGDGSTLQAQELLEQAAEARFVADKVIRSDGDRNFLD